MSVTGAPAALPGFSIVASTAFLHTLFTNGFTCRMTASLLLRTPNCCPSVFSHHLNPRQPVASSPSIFPAVVVLTAFPLNFLTFSGR